MKGKILGLLAVGLLGAQAADALVTTFTDENVFATQTSSALRSLPNVGDVSTITTTTGNLVIAGGSPGALYAGTASGFGQPNYVGKSGVEDWNITPTAGTYALGFSLYESNSPVFSGCNTTCVDSTFLLTLYSGVNSLGSFTLQPTDNSYNFYGYWTSSPITKIEIRETVGTNDNEFFGRFFTGSTINPATSTVPLPAAAWLLLSGLGGLGVVGRRRKTA